MSRSICKRVCSSARSLIIIIMCLIVFGCATWLGKSRRPDWVGGVSSEYPGSHYIIGVGSGADRQTSEDNARAEIAKVFKSCIQQRSYDFDHYLRIASGGKNECIRELDIRQVTTISTEKVLSGISVVDNYIDNSSDPPTHYALAVLNRGQTQNSLHEKIARADREIMNLIASAQDSTDTLNTIQQLKQAITTLVLREAYNEELRVVNPHGKGKPTRIRLQELKARLADVLKNQFNLAIDITGPYRVQIMHALIEAMTRSGFVVDTNPSEATVMVRGTINLTSPDIPHPKWKFVRWKVDFQLIDRRDGKIFGSVNMSGKEGQLTQSAAEKRAIRIIQEKLASQISQKLTNYIFGQQRH
ncbi:MAG: LPP20 family lipoprotein [Deltaproteobacteria bacterium]|nr:LPP20 family lipoprotein [Deltaproteobacteria bacterium]